MCLLVLVCRVLAACCPSGDGETGGGSERMCLWLLVECLQGEADWSGMDELVRMEEEFFFKKKT